MNSAAANEYTTPLCSPYSPSSIIFGLFHFQVHTALQTGSICQYYGVSATWKASLGITWTDLLSMLLCKLITTTIKTTQSLCPSDRTLLSPVKIRGDILRGNMQSLGNQTRMGRWVVPSLSNNVNVGQRGKKLTVREAAAAGHSNACHVAPGHCPPDCSPSKARHLHFLMAPDTCLAHGRCSVLPVNYLSNS